MVLEDRRGVIPSQYDLLSVVVHKGAGAKSGHYHAYVRDVLRAGAWSEVEAQRNGKGKSSYKAPAPEAPSYKMSVDFNHPDAPLMVCKAALKDAPGMSLTTDELCNTIMALIGKSWNKSFKTTWGPITQFLKRHSDTFLLNGQDVLLLESPPAAVEEHLEEKGSDGADEVKAPEMARAAAAAAVVPPEDDSGQWFDFDDSTVSPVLSARIDDTFGSSSATEVAYLLVYRRSDLGALPVIEPPPHILQEVFTHAPVDAADVVQLNVFVTQLDPVQQHPQVQMSVSSNLTAAALCKQLAERFGIPEEFLNVHIINSKGTTPVPAEAISIADCGVEGNSELLLENIVDRSDDTSLAALEYLKRQNLLEVFIEDMASEEKKTHKIMIERTATIAELRAMMLARLDSKVLDSVLQSAAGGRLRTPAGRLFSSEDKTMNDLSIYQGQTLVFEAKMLPRENEVLLRYDLLGPTSTGVTKDITVRLEQSLLEVKVMIATELGMDPAICRLRISGKKAKGKNLIQKEEQTVKQSGISSGTTIFVENIKLAAKDFVRVKLFQEIVAQMDSAAPTTNSTDANSSTGIFNAVAGVASRLFSSAAVPDSVPASAPASSGMELEAVPPFLVNVGEMAPAELNLHKNETTLFMLKEEISHALVANGYTVPSIEYIRISNTTGGEQQPREIFRHPDSTLQQLSITQDAKLLVTLLQEPEELPTNSALLRVYRRKAGTDAFTGPYPWLCMREGLSTATLVATAARVVGVPAERAAVYYLNSGWMAVEDVEVRTKTRKGTNVSIKTFDLSKLNDYGVLGIFSRKSFTIW